MAINEKETPKRRRVDLTKEREPFQRRLDSFARLLAAHSECVAVSVINGKLYITANELHSTSIDTKIHKSIEKIANYFKKVAQQKEILPKEREAIFLEICSTSRFKASVPEGFAPKIAKEVLAGKDPTISEIESSYGNQSEMAGLAYGKFTKLYEDFSKLEQTLYLPKEVTMPEPLQAFQSEFEILQKQLEKAHAEVQILDCVVTLVEQGQLGKGEKIYFGISKLCCMNCRCMIESANEVFKEKGIDVEVLTRGNHDINFNWNPSEKFRKGYGISSEKLTRHQEEAIEKFGKTLGFEIGMKGRSLVDRISKAKKPKGISMEASSSESESEVKISKKLNHKKKSLETSLNLLLSLQMQEVHSPLAQTIETLSIAIELYNLKAFTSLHKKEISSKGAIAERERVFASLYNKLSGWKGEGVSTEKLSIILKNSQLVGEEIASYFSQFDPSTVQKDISSPSPILTPGYSSKLISEEGSEQDQTPIPSSRDAKSPPKKKQKRPDR